MTPRWRAQGAGILALLLLGAAGVAVRAQDTDPPARAARLSDAEGAVSLQPAGVPDWTAAPINRPLTTGDRLWSDQRSRAELDLGTAAIRLGSNTGFGFLNLDDRNVQMQLSAGALIVSVRDLPNGESYEVDTPNIALSLQQPGVYRVEVNDQGSATAVAVSQGAAQAAGGGQSFAIGSQQVVTFTGVESLAWQSSTLGAPDEFDDWSALRERNAAESASTDYVAGDIPGTQDLDNNGQWQQTPEYGYVWVPTVVAVGWVPYRYGQWVWVTPWGWTWVDDARWGYAPFHYGRWVVWNNNWCWVPAPRHGGPARAVYAPALVAWVGGAPAGGMTPGSRIGWVPLGPRDVYVPPYRVSSTYVRNINIYNTTAINNTRISNVYQSNTPQHYVNDTPAAMTSVPSSIFISGQRVGAHTRPVAAGGIDAAVVSAAAPAILPTRQSVLGMAPTHGVARPPSSLMQRTLVVRSTPPPAPVPLERQLSAIAADGGRPPTRVELAVMQHGATLTPVKVVARPAPAVISAANRPATLQGLAERERVLQQSAFAPAPRANVSPPRPQADSSASALAEQLPSSAPVLRTDRPPSAQQHPAQTQQHDFVSEDPTRAVERPAAMPIYSFPSSAGAPDRAPVTTRQEGTHRAAPPPAAASPSAPAPHLAAPVAAHPVAAPPPVAHPPPPTPARVQSSQ